MGGEVEKKKKKSKRKRDDTTTTLTNSKSEIPPEKHEDENAAFPTVSIAIAGSIIDNAQSLELATLLAGQVARAATIFRIDEVVIFDNKTWTVDDSAVTTTDDTESGEDGAPFLTKILRYLETPQYLRRSLFPMHSNLKFVGLLPPLDAPHHVRKHEWSPFREGITLPGKGSGTEGTLVNVGLHKNVLVDQVYEPGVRVTVSMGTNRNLETDCPRKVVAPSSPREEMGLYWGYKIRYAPTISSVFSKSPYEGGYDHVIGTSEHGRVVNSSELDLPKFRHLLIAFGGLGGLEESIEEDRKLKGKDVKQVFSDYLNTCPNQGSRTIRSEEALFISLQYFQEPIAQAVQRFKTN